MAEDEISAWCARAGLGETLLVTGPSGVGKTTAVSAACAAADVEAVWIHAGAAKINIREAGASLIAVSWKRKLIIIDPYDGLAVADVAYFGEVAAWLKVKERAPAVLIAGGAPRARASDALPAKTTHVAMEGIDRTNRAVAASFAGNGSAEKDDPWDGLAIATRALTGSMTVSDVLRLADGTALSAVYERYPACYDALDIRDVARIADDFSGTDIMYEQACRDQGPDVLFEISNIPVASAAVRPPAPPEAAARAPKTFGTVWSQASARHAKLKNVLLVGRQRMEAGLSALDVTDVAYVRNMISARVAAADIPGAADVGRCAGLDAAGVLAAMRLWKGGYTLGSHAKIKKSLGRDLSGSV